MSDDEFDDQWGDVDESTWNEFAQLEQRGVSNAPAAKTATNASGSSFQAKSAVVNRLQQKDLFGNNAPQAGPSRFPGANGGTSSTSENVNVVVKKKWDRTAFAKSAAQRKQQKGKGKAATASKGSKGKGKGRAYYDEDGGEMDEDEDDVEDIVDFDDPLYDPTEAQAPPKPMKLQPDREACKTFVYPLNKTLRKYQYDIIAKALYTDTLVALPTGLGKTFLAAVVMLNFYRWFPKGKIIFMAPSRPLVTQQIAACHGIVGIPLKDAVELTGKDAPEKRQAEWEKRRVFYCTPQTVKNDLFAGKIDPTDVVCLVIDEAHKATGDYAYTEVVRFMMQKNPHFRVLALTATPGGNAEGVQNVIDALHIGNIEVRTDESFDIRPYIHTKKIDLVKIAIEGEIGSIRERYEVLMNILMKDVKDVIRSNKPDPTLMHPYTFRSVIPQLKNYGKPWLFTVVSFLAEMSQAMGKLLGQSVSAFYEDFKKLQTSAKGKAREVINHPNFAAILRDTQDIVHGKDFAGHPKMVKLRELVLEHFELAKQNGTLDSTRIMVFCSFRDIVEEIVERLNRSKEIRSTRLVGQGVDTKGKKGLGQKQQNQVLADFKKGEYNVLVATSIGEEGLDIGELDLIICYEAPKSSIRTLQRAGRTGRARDGRVIVLMTEGIEETNWATANENYKGVQNAIVSGKQFELYADCQRLIPDDIRPVANKVMLEIEPFDPDKMGIGHKKGGGTAKRKRDEKDNLDLFDTGFQKASGKKAVGAASTSKKVSTTHGREESDEIAQFPVTVKGDGFLSKQEKESISKLSTRPSVQAAQPAKQRTASLPSKLPPTSLPAASKRFIGTSSRTQTIHAILQQGAEHSARPSTFETWEGKLKSDLRWENVNKWWHADALPDHSGPGRDKKYTSCSFRPAEEDRETRFAARASSSTTGKNAASIKDDIGVMSDEDDIMAVPKIVEEEVSDTDLPDLPGISPLRPVKKAKSASTSGILPSKKEESSLPVESRARRDSKSPVLVVRPQSRSTSKQPVSTGVSPAVAPAEPSVQPAKKALPVVIDIDDDDEDESVMLIDPPVKNNTKAILSKPDSLKENKQAAGGKSASEKARSKSPAQPALTLAPVKVNVLRQPSPALRPDVFSTKPTLPADPPRSRTDDPPAEPKIAKAKEPEVIPDSDDMYDDLDDFDMDDIMPAVAAAKPTKSAADQIPVFKSPGGMAIRPVISEADAMPPPKPLPIVQKASATAADTADDSPIVLKRPRQKGKRVMIADESTSSPDKVTAQARKPFKLANDSDIVMLSAPRAKGKLVRAVDKAGQPSEEQKKKKKKKKLPADQCPFFQMKAINSDDPDSETDPEDDYGGPETTIDRRFVDSDDIQNPNDMSAFYRESLMSQANHRFHGSVRKPGTFKMRVDAAKRYVAPRRDEEQANCSQYSQDSFCVGDDDGIVYTDEDDGLPDEDEILTSEGK